MVSSSSTHADSLVEAMVSALIAPPSTDSKEEDSVLTEKDALEMVSFPQAVEDMLLASARPYATEMRLNGLTFLEQVLKYCQSSGNLMLLSFLKY